MNKSLKIACFATLISAPALHAQAFGGTFGGWITTGARPENDPATGFRLSAYYDHAWQQTARVRIEGAFVQAGFTRDFATRLNQHVTENSIELGVHLMSRLLGASRFRAFAGPVVSVGIGCGTDGLNDSNGRVACDGDGGDGATRVGAAVGLHSELGATGRMTVDFRAQANTIASTRGRGPAIAVAVGLRLPR